MYNKHCKGLSRLLHRAGQLVDRLSRVEGAKRCSVASLTTAWASRRKGSKAVVSAMWHAHQRANSACRCSPLRRTFSRDCREPDATETSISLGATCICMAET